MKNLKKFEAKAVKNQNTVKGGGNRGTTPGGDWNDLESVKEELLSQLCNQG